MAADAGSRALGEPQRAQYLEAMGLTPWVSRYRLPNALETPECDWQAPAAEPQTPPAQRLHALLDAPATPASDPAPAETAPPRPARAPVKRARALLGETPADDTSHAPDTREAPVATAAPSAEPSRQEPLRFTLQVAALDGRWLVVQPGEAAPDGQALTLFANLLRAGGIELAGPPDFQHFRWPLMPDIPAEAPLEEARDGLRAFIEGRRRRGWNPERVLLFGADETLARVLDLADDRSGLLGLPVWQSVSLAELSRSASAKRDLWPRLAEWRDAWHHPGAEPASDA
ncbi:hypothetical protein [Modicisalibacter sp. MOD 31.J]|uniref:hypothetical protein n=1 Tax=Modicisalibacter sp. MOD 31.J TaxID=2831897 RepID=UPI001CCDFE4D